MTVRDDVTTVSQVCSCRQLSAMGSGGRCTPDWQLMLMKWASTVSQVTEASVAWWDVWQCVGLSYSSRGCLDCGRV